MGTANTGTPTIAQNQQQTQPIQPTQPTLFIQTPSQQPQNTFKFKAYETAHVELWMEGKQEGGGVTKITARLNNKTSSLIDQVFIQTAVLKYLKIANQAVSGSSLSANSKGEVSQ
jgi:hypothetical protein